MLRLYDTALAPFRLAMQLWARLPRRDPAKRREWSERAAIRVAAPEPGGVWIHGASVGEARIVGSLAAELRARRPELPISVSAMTVTGRAQLPVPPAVDAAFFAPLDFRGLPTRVLHATRPALLILVETELWPNLVREAAQAAIPVAVVNGRLSSRRMSRYRRFAGFYGPLLRRMARVGAQSEEDAERFRALGAPAAAVVVTGNVKYDLEEPAECRERLIRRLGLSSSRPVFVAGSTGRGEDELVLRAFAEVRRAVPELMLVLAPRHPERVERVDQLVRAAGHSVRRLSDDAARDPAIDVLLVDTVGELAGLYQLGCVAFVGGSLVPVGGHNVLEPAVVGVPVLFGPHTENARETASALENVGAAERVPDVDGLTRALSVLLGDGTLRRAMGTAGRDFVRSNRGALDRTVDLLLDALAASRSQPSGSA